MCERGLPGDARGWTKRSCGKQPPQPLLAGWCAEQMIETPCFLNQLQRQLVQQTIREHSEKRKWFLHAVNCRTNHFHLVVTAHDYDGKIVRDQFKAWCTRKLKQLQRSQGVGEDQIRRNWWTAKGSVRLIFDDESLEAAIIYTLEAQDAGGSKAN